MFENDHEEAPSTLNDAIKMIAAGLDALARVDLDQEDDRALLDATAALQEHRDRFDGQRSRPSPPRRGPATAPGKRRAR